MIGFYIIITLLGKQSIASLSPTKVSTPETLTEIRRISLTIASFNARRGAFLSEGGGEFEFRVFVYLPTTSFFLGGGATNTEQRKYILL